MRAENLNEISAFFHNISPAILDIVSINANKFRKIISKPGKGEVVNFATETDFEVERVLTDEIKKRFPQDSILAEETFSETKLNTQQRVWIIDPLCGTANFARGIKFFVSNVAVAQEGRLIAACAIDHSQHAYIWSIGNNKLFINNHVADTKKDTPGIEVEVDMSSLLKCAPETKRWYAHFVSRLLTETDYAVLTHATSLSFTYVALGRIDAYVSADVYPWDVATANFLTQEAGGIVTEITGDPWKLTSGSVLAARNKGLHKALLALLQKVN